MNTSNSIGRLSLASLAAILASAAAIGAHADEITSMQGIAAPALMPLAKYDCRAAKAEIEHKGYRVLAATDCSGLQYAFVARRGQAIYNVLFSAESGGLVEVPR